jgi:outer membrane protein assembly factor BamB
MRQLTLFVLAASLGGCFMFQDSDKVISNPPNPLLEINPTLEVVTNWSIKLPAIDTQIHSLSVVSNESNIFVIAGQNELISINLVDGDISWRITLAEVLTAGPAVANGKVFVGSVDGSIIALAAEDGQELWTSAINKEISSSISASNQAIIFHTSDGTLYALSSTAGSVLWSAQQEAPVLTIRGSAQSIISGNTVIAGFDNGRVSSYDLFSGAVLWDVASAIPTGTSQLDRIIDVADKMALRGNTIYAVNVNGNLSAIDVNAGSIIWSQPASSLQGLALATNEVVMTTDESHVSAYSTQTAQPIWLNEDLTNRRITAPSVLSGALVVGDFEGYLHFLANDTGTVVQRLAHSQDAIGTDPLVVGTSLVVMSNDGLIKSYSLAN